MPIAGFKEIQKTYQQESVDIHKSTQKIREQMKLLTCRSEKFPRKYQKVDSRNGLKE